MANLAYCRFRNTLRELRDCYDYMDEQELSEEETRARAQLIELCAQIVYNYGADDEETDQW